VIRLHFFKRKTNRYARLEPKAQSEVITIQEGSVVAYYGKEISGYCELFLFDESRKVYVERSSIVSAQRYGMYWHKVD